eukprot:TRINITY_DN27783_c0_g1_i1.p1 TRINITY_DN27783_c0_g1~~TRINITY_DN27783_c0_g1_i1.p1  ORF type:complete len:207 (+),score=31.10 TRINITY_DN27783_c0_g1_i1:50-670(+)
MMASSFVALHLASSLPEATMHMDRGTGAGESASIVKRNTKSTATCDCWQWCLSRKKSRSTTQVSPMCSHSWQERAVFPSVGEFRRATAGRQTQAPAFEARLPCGLYPSQVTELLDRDITPEDYEILLQLDQHLARTDVASRSDVESLATADEKDFAGETCSVCLYSFAKGDDVSALLCGHLFHRDCISKWLLESSRKCPVCAEEVL